MKFFSRPWSDGEKWIMGILAASIGALFVYMMKDYKWSNVALEIASKRDIFGRCIDKEMLIKNNTSSDATEIQIVFDVDYFTERGDVAIEYGTAEDMLISPAEPTLIKKSTSLPIDMILVKNSLKIPKLQPNESIHIFFGGETYIDQKIFEPRTNLLKNKDIGLMDKPTVKFASRKDGSVEIKRSVKCISSN